MKTVRFNGTESYDHQPVIIATDRIVYARKVDDNHVKIMLDTGEYLYVEEQLNVVEARINLSKEES